MASHRRRSGGEVVIDPSEVESAMAHDIGRIDPETAEALRVLGGVLRELRSLRGLSQRGLAGRSGLSQSTISRLECGLAPGVRVAWVARLLAGLDMVIRIIPDDRPPVERTHALKLLNAAFSPAAGDARRRARDARRSHQFETYLRELESARAASTME